MPARSENADKPTGGRRAALPPGLGEAEPVPRVVLYDSFDAVELLLRRRDELDTLRAQALVVAVDVVGLEDADAEGAALDQPFYLLGLLGVEHGPGSQRGEDDLEVRLPLWAQRQPADIALVGHGHVGAHLEAELVPVELECLLLIRHEYRRVALALDHG